MYKMQENPEETYKSISINSCASVQFISDHMHNKKTFDPNDLSYENIQIMKKNFKDLMRVKLFSDEKFAFKTNKETFNAVRKSY